MHSASQVAVSGAWEVHTTQVPVDVYLKGGKVLACVKVECDGLFLHFSRSQPFPLPQFP